MILAIVYFQTAKTIEKEVLQHKLFIRIIQITSFLLLIDIFSRFDGKPDTIYPFINHFGNFIIFMLNPVLPSIWLAYVHYQVFQDEIKTKKLFYPLLSINMINLILLIFNQFYGLYYYIDSDNIYHRGPFFGFSASITILLLLIATMLTIVNRKRIEKKYYYSLLFFSFPPLVGIALQINIYGLSLILNSIVISILVVFFNIQNRSIHIDYLTGVNNRKKIDAYLKDKIIESLENKTFSAIMLDINDFKTINDTYGHDIGDYVLQASARLLKACIGVNGFIGRYGGDEFYIILDISDRQELEKMVCKINGCIERYNESNDRPYTIGFSMGYAVYDFDSNLTVGQFQKHIDLLLYQNKQANKIALEND